MALRLVKEYELLKKVDYLDNYPLNTKFKKPALCAGFFITIVITMLLMKLYLYGLHL